MSVYTSNVLVQHEHYKSIKGKPKQEHPLTVSSS